MGDMSSKTDFHKLIKKINKDNMTIRRRTNMFERWHHAEATNPILYCNEIKRNIIHVFAYSQHIHKFDQNNE